MEGGGGGRGQIIFVSEYIQCWHIITLMEYTKFSSLPSCLLSVEQYVAEGLFISADLYCSFVYIKGFSATAFTVGEKPCSTRPTIKSQKFQLFLCTQIFASGSCNWSGSQSTAHLVAVMNSFMTL